MSRTFNINGRPIGPGHPPYVVAEMSGNHNGDINRALAIMDMAHKAGADAVKLQTYRADTLTIDDDGPDFKIKGGPWDGKTLYRLYEKAHTPWEWHEALFAKGKKLGLTVFSTPFDKTAIELLEDLGAPAHKLASFELVDLALIEQIAATGKPLIMSTGMADETEIKEAVGAARKAGGRDIILLHCVSGYPSDPLDANLKTMAHMEKTFGVPVGLSDHTLGAAVSIAAVALGACFIEKHVTLSRADGGADSGFSLEPPELEELVLGCRAAFDALGRVSYERKKSERGNDVFRRSVYVVADVKAGETFSAENVRSIRPGYGLLPKYLPDILGQRAIFDIARGTALSWDMVEGKKGGDK
jgi:pseudaminic acid synthase